MISQEILSGDAEEMKLLTENLDLLSASCIIQRDIDSVYFSITSTDGLFVAIVDRHFLVTG